MWHAEIAALVLRHYRNGLGFELHLSFDGVAFAKSVGRGVMFIEGALRVTGEPLSLDDWKDLGRLLLKDFGVHTIKADRRSKEVIFDVKRILKIKE